MRHERQGHTWQATELVNEAWLKLFRKDKPMEVRDRKYFYGAAAQAMHRLLLGHFRRKDAQKRGKKVEMPTAAFDNLVRPEQSHTIFLFDEALSVYGKTHPETVELIKLRYSGGWTAKDAAKVLQISKPQSDRVFRHFKSWFKGAYGKELQPGFGLAKPI